MSKMLGIDPSRTSTPGIKRKVVRHRCRRTSQPLEGCCANREDRSTICQYHPPPPLTSWAMCPRIAIAARQRGNASVGLHALASDHSTSQVRLTTSNLFCHSTEKYPVAHASLQLLCVSSALPHPSGLSCRAVAWPSLCLKHRTRWMAQYFILTGFTDLDLRTSLQPQILPAASV